MLGATTGTWFIVKWVGIAILALYSMLIGVAIWRFRSRLSRRRWRELSLAVTLGNFVSFGLPLVFENVTVTRVCLVTAQAIYFGGIVILVRALARADQKFLSQADDIEERMQLLKPS